MPPIPRAVLVIALSGIGDALMFTPALRFLRRVLPDARIDALVMFRGVDEIYSRTGCLTAVHYFDFLNESRFDALRFVLGLRGRYDASVSVYPSNRTEYNLIHYLIGAQRRGALRYTHADAVNLGFLNTIRLTEDDTLHNVLENVALCELLLGIPCEEEYPLSFPLSEPDTAFARQYCAGIGLGQNDFAIGFHTGSATFKNMEQKRWSTAQFAALAKKLIDAHDAKVLLFGGPEENDVKEEIVRRSGSPAVINVETPSLAHSAAVMTHCSVCVTNDSGIMHIASALNLPVVALFGPTNARKLHPWRTTHRIVSLNLDCAPCFYYSPRPLTCTRTDRLYKCMKELPVEKVYEAVLEICRKK